MVKVNHWPTNVFWCQVFYAKFLMLSFLCHFLIEIFLCHFHTLVTRFEDNTCKGEILCWCHVLLGYITRWILCLDDTRWSHVLLLIFLMTRCNVNSILMSNFVVILYEVDIMLTPHFISDGVTHKFYISETYLCIL